LTALGILRMLPVLQRFGDAYGFWLLFLFSYVFVLFNLLTVCLRCMFATTSVVK